MTLLSKAVAIADKVTQNLGMQGQVTHKMFTGDGGTGDPQYATKKRFAAIEQKVRQVRSFSGEMVTSTTKVTFVRPTPMGLEGGAHDLIVLPDGTGGPILSTGGPVDASGQLIAEAYLG